jgi:predicted GIY-YIG superfamily endonuclease
MSNRTIAPQRTALYRFYDAAWVLLYVGITDDLPRRLREHARDKEWFSQVRHQAVSLYDGERQARKAETRAIHAEVPRHNIAGALEPPRPVMTVNRRAWAAAAAAWGVLSVAVTLLSPLMHIPGLVLTVTTSGAFVLLALVTLFSYTPFPLLAYRFGCWLYRNFGDDVMEAGR